MVAPGSPRSAKRCGTVLTVKRGRVDVRHFVPLQRTRDARVRQRADGVRGRDGAVARVLVVVDEDAVALFLPPPRRRQRGDAALDLAADREGGAAHVRECPLRLDAYVDVDAARAGCLRIAAVAELREDVAHAHRHLAHVGERGFGRRIEVDPQLVGMVDVVGAYRPGVEVEASEVDHPGEIGSSLADDEVRAAAAGERDACGAHAVGQLLRRSLLEERLAGRALQEALQHHRPAADAA